MGKKSNIPDNKKDDDLIASDAIDTEKNDKEILDAPVEKKDEDESLIDASDKENDTLNDDIIKFKEDISKYTKEAEALKDKLVRLAAEYDNFRKRSQKEKENIYTDVCEDVLKLFLPVFDNLERANTISDGFDELKKGIELTIKQFKEALSKLNVEEIDTKVKFNPHMHEAVMHCLDDNYGEKDIVEVFLKGYKRGDKILRHSMVKVAN
ncbi:MAG: nucleotide exchange factor GrpE [Oscillospiraceae bacterium]|nr:nucleotide exchange factor GrpE [Oscillospiraceae bacterium]